MTNTDNRNFVSDTEAWDVFVGQLTPKEFCKGFASPDAAVQDFMTNYPFDEPAPSWLRGSLIEYIEKAREMDEIDWFEATLELADIQPEYDFTASVKNPYI